MADHSLYPKDACQPCVAKQIHLLHQLCPTDVFCFLPRMHRDFSLGCHGLRLPCGYMLSFALQLHPEQHLDCSAGCWLLVVWFPGYLCPSISDHLVVLLYPSVINHFSGDLAPWIVLSCTDTYLIDLVAFIISFIVILGSCVITLLSYIYIISTVLTIPSDKEWRRAFLTCSSHLTVVIIWYGWTIFLHVSPSMQNSLELTKIVTILNTIVTPLLNPFIYTLRNPEVKEALRHVFREAMFFKMCWRSLAVTENVVKEK
ncbi:unnamed protein product [Eretmochelys imbricata]